MQITTYKNLIVWQKAVSLAISVYRLTQQFPAEEKFGLAAQLNRAAVSIPSNIAEGRLRGSNNEFRRFLLIAYGSAGEVETQLHIAKHVLPLSTSAYRSAETILEEVLKMLNTLIRKHSPSSSSSSLLTPHP